MIDSGSRFRAIGAYVAVCILVVTLSPPAAASTFTFAMSTSVARAGESVKISEVSPCPASTTVPLSTKHVEIAFTSSAGHVSLWGTYYDAQGHWREPVLMSTPHIRILNFNPLQYSSDVHLGVGEVRVRCKVSDTVTREYAPRPLRINALSAGFTVSSKTLKLGHQVTLTSVLPCPEGSASVDGAMSHGMPMAFRHFQAPLNAAGHWSVSFTVPSQFPQGYALFDAFCRPPGEHQGTRTQAYSEAFADVTPNKYNYVAWGDSFSSGEGVEPFEAPTGGTGCHRSRDAYSRVLERDSSLKLLLGKGFVACSGATNSAIVLGDGKNPAQMNTLKAETDLVTMTISGNDMRFVNYAFSCAAPLQGKSCSGSEYDVAVARIKSDVIPRLRYTLGTIRDRLITLGNSDAVVLVLGYPHLVPSKWHSGAAGCWWLQPNETSAMRDVTQRLNEAIKKEVQAIGYNFHFVSATDAKSPFIGHELCRSTSDKAPGYFNNVVIGGPDAYTFHPNKAGQAAYAALVKRWLLAHPLG